MVCEWIGNSPLTAAKHYLQVTDEHFKQAVQNPVQKSAAPACIRSQEDNTNGPKSAICGPVRGDAKSCNDKDLERLGAGGFEPPKANANGFTARPLWPLGYTPLSFI